MFTGQDRLGTGSRQTAAPASTTRTRRAANRQSPPPSGPSTGGGLGTSAMTGTGLFGGPGGREKNVPGYQQRGGEQQREREREQQQQQHTDTGGAMELSEEQKAEINEAVSDHIYFWLLSSFGKYYLTYFSSIFSTSTKTE